MRRAIAASVFLGALCVLAMILVRGDRPEGGRTPRNVERASMREAEPGPPEAAPEKGLGSEAPARSEEENAPESEPDSGIAIGGTLVVVDAGGAERPATTGQIHLTHWRGSSGSGQAVTVTDGAWIARVPADVRLEIQERATVEGDPAVVVSPTREFRIPRDEKIVVKVRRSKATILRVVDAATGQDLPEVTIVSTEEFPRENLAHPGDFGDTRVVRRSVPSPIPISPGGRTGRWTSYLVGSPGRAWTRIDLDRAIGGERLVRLAPGGRLELTLAGPADGVVRLRPENATSRKPIAEVSRSKRARIEFDGLVVGRHRVILEIGDWWREPRILAEATIEIRAGETTLVTLQPKAVEPAPLVPLAGVVVLPPEWEIGSPFLAVRLRDPVQAGGRSDIYPDLEEVSEGEGTWRFDAGRVQPGRYHAELSGCEFEIVFVVEQPGLSDLRIEVPPPGRVVVTVLDAATGKPADLEDIDWHCRRPEPDMGGSVQSAERDDRTGRYEFRAPQGEVVIGVVTDGWRVVQKRVRVGPGTTEATLRVTRTGGSIHLTVWEGDAAVPWKFDWEIRVEPVGGAGRVLGGCYRADGRTVELSHEGLYRVRFPTLPGFEPVPEAEVRVRSGQVTPLEIRLERAR